MGICQYFLNGYCRFGSKCLNEHFDVKQIIKTEVEAALNGSQWPISCFGPFKEKPCLENFISDQSFEEIRYLCYEAKKTPQTFPAFQQQFTQQVIDSQNKMKALLSLSREIIDVVVNLYNNNSESGQNINQQPASNPFSMGGTSSTGQNRTSLFGNSTTQSNPFANSGFANPTNSSIFGGGQTQSPASGGLFNQTSFGGGENAFTGQKPSAFGGQTNNFNPQGQPIATNVFGMQQQQQQQQQQPQQSSPFGPGSGSGNNGFGNTSLFSQSAFTQPTQQQQSFTGFSQQPQGAAPNVFTNQQQTAPGIFAQAAANQNIFSTQQQPNAFAAPPNQAFSQQVDFGQPQANAGGSNIFSAQTQSTFGGAQQPVMGGIYTGHQNTFQQSNNQSFASTYESAYSKMEELTADAIEAFNAPDFVLGNIPTVPPPRDLCN